MSKITSFMFLGDAKDAENFEFLSQNNITFVLNVTRDVPCFFPGKIMYKRIGIDDDPNENIKRYFEEATNFIETARKSNQAVLVHCLAGISRSTTIVIHYLMSHLGFSFQSAYDHVKRCRPQICPNFGFIVQLH